MDPKTMDRLKSVFWGLLFLAGGFWFWLYTVGNPISELALIRRGVTTQGFISSFRTKVEDAGPSKMADFRYATYTFQLPDGRTFRGEADDHRATLPDDLSRIEVEYLPDDPTVNRIKGSSSSCLTVTDWLLRKVCVGGLLLAIVLSPGATIIYKEFYPRPEKLNQ